MVDAANFKNAMALLTGAVNVVTTSGASGRYGFTASAVCSVTDAPPTLLVCMNKASSAHEHFIANKVLAINVLNAHQQQIAQAFSAQMSPEERYEYGFWSTLKTGAPILEEALVSFDCHIEHSQDVGTHSIFICHIVAIQHGHHDQKGLVYFKRAYHPVGKAEVAETLY